MLLKSHCFLECFIIDFLQFLVILAPKMKGLGGDFSMKFGFHRENVDFVKIMVFHMENCYFSKLGLPKIDKKL